MVRRVERAQELGDYRICLLINTSRIGWNQSIDNVDFWPSTVPYLNSTGRLRALQTP